MVRNCRLKIGCWISGHRETAERIITMKLGYLEFVEVLSKQLLNALNLQEQQIFFKKKAIDNKDRLFVEAFENSSGKQLCGIDVKDLYERCMEGSSMESILYSVQEEIEKLKMVSMLEGKMTPDSYQKIKKYLFVKPLNKKNHSLEMEDAVHEDVGDIACVLYMMRSNTNEYFTGIKIKNKHLEQWEMTKEAVMEEALKNTCQMAPLSFVLMMRTSGEDPLWRMEHSAYRKVIKLWVFDFPQIQKNMERFPYFTLVSFKDWHSLWEVICTFYLQVGMKVQFTVQMRVI